MKQIRYNTIYFDGLDYFIGFAWTDTALVISDPCGTKDEINKNLEDKCIQYGLKK